ncbi:MAG: hypothetical protein ABIY37_16910, partial [Devosia sp.]
MAVAGLLLLGSPAYAACSTTDLTPTLTATGDPAIVGDQAYIVDDPSTGLYFEDDPSSANDSVTITNNNVAIDGPSPGIAVFGEFDTICYDGLASGSIVSDDSGVVVIELSDGDVLLDIAHDIDAGFAGIEVSHGGDGLIDITARTIGAVDAGIIVQRGGNGDTDITANGAIAATLGPGIVVMTLGDGNITIDTLDDISSGDSGISVMHWGDDGDISITTAVDTTISAHGGLGPPLYALTIDGTVGIYVDRSGSADSDITIANGADIDVDAVGMYIDVCSCIDANILVNSTGTIDVDEGFGIYVSQGATGDTTVNQSGKVTVQDGTGLVVTQFEDGNVIAGLTGGVDATDEGILVQHAADGNITVHAGGTFDITGGSGIDIFHEGSGDVSVASSAAMTASHSGIVVEHLGETGNVMVMTSAGTALSLTGSGSVGIAIDRDDAGSSPTPSGTVAVTNSAHITADFTGIDVYSAVNGTVAVTSTGQIDIANGTGIVIQHTGNGDTSASATGGIAANTAGIDLTHTGAGNASATAGGTWTIANGPGILINKSGNGNVTVTSSANITADTGGIRVVTSTTGPVTINSTGSIDVDSGDGISVLAEGPVTVETSGRITTPNGTGVAISGSNGNVRVTANGEIAAFIGIQAATGAGNIDITTNAKVAGGLFGITAAASSPGAITVATNADIVGPKAAIDLSPGGHVSITTAAGKTLKANSGTDTFGYDSFVPLTGGAGISIGSSSTSTRAIDIVSRSNIETNGVGIFIQACAGCAGTTGIEVIGNIVAPYGIIAGDNDVVDLDIAGDLTAEGGVLMGGTTIDAIVRAGASVTVNSNLAGRYGLKFDGTSEITIAGTVDVPGADAILFTGGNAKLTLLPGFVINGRVDALNTAMNDLIFGGTTGAASFDLDRLGTDITDFDTFLKTGSSSWTFSGANFTGLLTANAGTVVINSAIPGLDLVLENTTFHGNAGLKSLTTTGGTLAPGNSIGTVTVAGNATIGANTVYEVEVNAAGASDKLVAGGTATIDSTANVLASMEPGSFGAVTQYAIITAAGGVSGAFSGVNSVSAFYDAQLTYDANNAYLTLTRNFLTLGDFAVTPGQEATAAALDGGGQGAPYFDELLVLPAGEVPGALDAISGDGYASLAAAALDNGRFVRDAALDRQGARGIWTTPYGGVSHLPGDGNGPGVDHATGGLLLG